MNSSEFFDPARCPLCGGPNHCLLCATTPYKGRCWCSQEEMPAELLARVPEPLRDRACICRGCLENFRQKKKFALLRPPQM
jgi:hypothetical protein